MLNCIQYLVSSIYYKNETNLFHQFHSAYLNHVRKLSVSSWRLKMSTNHTCSIIAICHAYAGAYIITPHSVSVYTPQRIATGPELCDIDYFHFMTKENFAFLDTVIMAYRVELLKCGQGQTMQSRNYHTMDI